MKKVAFCIAVVLLVASFSSCVIVGDDVLGTVKFTNTDSRETVVSIELKDDDETVEEKNCRLECGENVSFSKLVPDWEYYLVIRTASGHRYETDEFTVECGETVRCDFDDLY